MLIQLNNFRFVLFCISKQKIYRSLKTKLQDDNRFIESIPVRSAFCGERRFPLQRRRTTSRKSSYEVDRR